MSGTVCQQSMKHYMKYRCHSKEFHLHVSWTYLLLSLTLYNYSCVILMSCYCLYISLLNGCACLQMTLIECQSPLEAGSWGSGILADGSKSLMKPLPPSPLYLCHRVVCLGNALLPLKPHFHLKSSIPQLPLATHSLSLRIPLQVQPQQDIS